MIPDLEVNIEIDTTAFVREMENVTLALYSMSGKTTRLIEEAVRLLSELPSHAAVYITGAHPQWLQQLSHDFKASGLVDVHFLTVTQIKNGYLRGCRGVLLIDDFFDLSWGDREFLLHEKNILRWS